MLNFEHHAHASVQVEVFVVLPPQFHEREAEGLGRAARGLIVYAAPTHTVDEILRCFSVRQRARDDGGA